MGRIKRAALLGQKAWVVGAVAGLLIATAACQSVAGAAEKVRPFSNPAKDCFAKQADLIDLDSMWEDTRAILAASKCEDEIAKRKNGDEANSNARFTAAKAKRILFESTGGTDPKLVEEAERLFTAASSANPYLKTEGKVELARVHRLQGRYELARGDLASEVSSPSVQVEQALATLADLKGPRGEALASDAKLSQRNTALGLLRNNLHSSVAYVSRVAPVELANQAVALGLDALDAPSDTGANTERALGFFTDAGAAVGVLREGPRDREFRELAPRVYFNLGRAKLRKAGFARSNGDAQAECVPPAEGARGGPEDPLVSAAAIDFREASTVAPSADIRWGLGCVELLRRNPAGASTEFNEAVKGPLKDVKDWEVLRSLGWATSNPAKAAEFFDAAARKGPPAPALARLYIDQAKKYNESGDAVQARTALNRVLGNSGAYPPSALGEAQVFRALLLFPDLDPKVAASLQRSVALDDVPVKIGAGDLQKVDEARKSLQQAVLLKAEPAGLASYYLSRLEQGVPEAKTSRARAQAAVAAADQAVISSQQDRPEFRRQACLMRVKFWLELDPKQRDEGALRCTAQSTADPNDTAEQLLFQGLFHLRSSFTARGGDQQRAWANGLSSFQTGLNLLGSAGLGDGDRRVLLRARLARGATYAVVCSGMGAAMNSFKLPDIESQQRAAADNFLIAYGFERCPA